MSNILIPNPQDFNEKFQKIIAWWPEKFHVIADFDRTLTNAFVDGKSRPSLVTVMENKWYLWPDFSEKSKKNFEKYHPIEIDPNISLEEKKVWMHNRRRDQFELMITSWLSREIIKKTIQSEEIIFRDWYQEFFDLLYNAKIPLVIFSASGLWYEGIYYSLEKVKKLYDNVDIISNAFVWDENGKAIAIKEPIIHSFNKEETLIKDFPIYDEIKERKNIILLGDGLGDVKMADGFDYENIIKIWFLNRDKPEYRETFSEVYDLLILGDGPMDEVNEILKKILMR